MQVIRVRAWVRCALWAFLALLGALVALLSLPEPDTVAPRSPRRHLPADYWAHQAYYPARYARSSCISPPSGVHQLQHVAAFWQRVTSEEKQVLVFAAYWDERERERGPLVRLLVYSDHSAIKLRCLFWYYDKGDPVSTEASIPVQEGDRNQEETDADHHQVATCVVPTTPSRELLAAVSLVPVDFRCGMTRNLLVIQNFPESADDTPAMSTLAPPTEPRLEGVRMGVCIVWWRPGDAATRLAEWLELLRYFGVHRVFLYINNNAHDNVLRVVDHFSWQANLDSMTLDVMPYASPPVLARNTSSAGPERHDDFDEYGDEYKTGNGTDSERDEKIYIQKDDRLPYNECVYRALGERLAWLALLDVDEVIVALRDGIWERLTVKESRAAKYHTDELPDVLDIQRWWFPEMLQINLTTSPPERLKPSTMREGHPGRFTSPAPPLLVPPGRIFNYKWSSPTARDDETVTGKLLRPSSVQRVQAREIVCLKECQTRYVDNDVARVHLYTSRCGGASRGVCRALRRVAVRNDALWKWRRAQQEAALELRRLRLRKHAHSHHDDE